MTKKKIIRGINEEMADALKNSCLHHLYTESQEELFFGIRNGYLNLYYNCDSIAKIEYKRKRTDKEKKIYCTINNYYLNGKNGIDISPETIHNCYQEIKDVSDQKSKKTLEKRAQALLITKNNSNPKSKWFCLDVEYRKQFHNRTERDNSGFKGRFDIIAISKTKPYNIALIELKYGSKAIGGNSGIYKHIKDFKLFQDKGYFKSLKQEIVNIIKAQVELGVNVPKELHGIEIKDILTKPEFYFIILNNNKEKNGSTPKQTMAGYLFKPNNNKYKDWKCKRSAKHCVEDDFGDITQKNNDLHATFLFSKVIIPETETAKTTTFGITDIINGEYDEIIRPE